MWQDADQSKCVSALQTLFLQGSMNSGLYLQLCNVFNSLPYASAGHARGLDTISTFLTGMC